MQWPVVIKYTLPREEEASQPEGWIQGITKIGPELEIATCCLHVSTELRSEFRL